MAHKVCPFCAVAANTALSLNIYSQLKYILMSDSNSSATIAQNGLLAAVFSVECCSRCPFYEYQDEMMDSSCRADENVIFGNWKRVDKWVNKEVHHSCPLKRGSIAVHLKNGS